MGLYASDKGGDDFEITPAGVYHAVCYGVVDLGTQHNKKFNNWSRKIMIQWELPTERIDITEDNRTISKPRAISRRFGLSLGTKSHLRPFLESWRNKKFTTDELMGFNLENLIGVNCMLQVLHNEYEDKTYANVQTVMPLSKDAQKLDTENPSVFYSMDDSGLLYPNHLPDWIKKIIMDSREYNETGQMNDFPNDAETPPVETYDDDIPF